MNGRMKGGQEGLSDHTDGTPKRMESGGAYVVDGDYEVLGYGVLENGRHGLLVKMQAGLFTC